MRTVLKEELYHCHEKEIKTRSKRPERDLNFLKYGELDAEIEGISRCFAQI